MNIESLILNRRTVHDYQPGDIAIDLVKQAIQMGVYAPSHKLTFPWHFAIGGKNILAQLGPLSAELKNKKKPLTDVQKKAVINKFASTTWMLAVAQKRCENEFQRKEDYASVACAVQNMSLYLWDKGIGTKWTSGAITEADETYKIFKLDKNLFEIVGLFWIGHALRVPKTPQRPSLENFYSLAEPITTT